MTQTTASAARACISAKPSVVVEGAKGHEIDQADHPLAAAVHSV